MKGKMFLLVSLAFFTRVYSSADSVRIPRKRRGKCTYWGPVRGEPTNSAEKNGFKLVQSMDKESIVFAIGIGEIPSAAYVSGIYRCVKLWIKHPSICRYRCSAKEKVDATVSFLIRSSFLFPVSMCRSYQDLVQVCKSEQLEQALFAIEYPTAAPKTLLSAYMKNDREGFMHLLKTSNRS